MKHRTGIVFPALSASQNSEVTTLNTDVGKVGVFHQYYRLSTENGNPLSTVTMGHLCEVIGTRSMRVGYDDLE